MARRLGQKPTPIAALLLACPDEASLTCGRDDAASCFAGLLFSAVFFAGAAGCCSATTH
jgi:hypothetical protein